MGIFNSLHRYDPEDDVPVMGLGYCPFYDAALVGDWDRLQILCDEAQSKILKGSNGVIESGKKSVASLDSLDGGHGHGEARDGNFSSFNQSAGNIEAKNSQNNQTAIELHVQNAHGTKDNRSDCYVYDKGKFFVDRHEKEESKSNEIKNDLEYSEQMQQPFSLFVDKKGNTALHMACRRDPPVATVRSLIALHPKSVWNATNNDWLPLHLACCCGCEVEVASELLNAMEARMVEGQRNIQLNDDDYDEPLLPRESKGRTPLHLACSSSRNPQRRPDLVRLLLLRSKDPKSAALAKDWITFDQKLGVELASGDFQVILGGLSEKGQGTADINKPNHLPTLDQTTKSISIGRSPLNLIEADFKEEIEGALQLGFPLAKSIETFRGMDKNVLTAENLNTIYEAWAMLSVLLLSAGGIGTAERIKETLGGMSNNDDHIIRKSILEIVQNFQAIFEACSSLDNEICSPKIKELCKKFLEGEVDKRNIESVSDLKSKWENMANEEY